MARAEDKKADYGRYQFSESQKEALNAFFDLTQEYIYTDDHYRLCVAIPKVFFDLDAALHLVQPDGDLHLLCSTTGGLVEAGHAQSDLTLTTQPHQADHRLVLPLKGHKSLQAYLPFSPPDNVLGLLVVWSSNDVDPDLSFFLEKYANRIGYSLHNKELAQKNVEHLQFINSLVADIGHNVIVPNMFFKAFLRRLRGKVAMNLQLERDLDRELGSSQLGVEAREKMAVFLRDMTNVNEGLEEELGNLTRHYEQTSLFLETLLRRAHFERGGYVLEKRLCNFNQRILGPQLERFRERLSHKGIDINVATSGIPDEEIEVVVDMGLISQVYANLFSNAAKYTRAVVDGNGRTLKYMSYGMEHLENAFGPERHGIKFNVFTTGPHLDAEDAAKVFKEGYRGKNTDQEPGTGHGLRFVKDVVELHGGRVGYESTATGNNFFFVLPQ
ncbi:MAG: HAMP domain-containing histidine kinase [Proteobacteria bacterium]|nr:HAMP domain-containing histidine kinase [Pseudomonadota bacterium]MBU1741650.1 HAMP domain-containing histidine kinase [Pseudomonadota bacterium]